MPEIVVSLGVGNIKNLTRQLTAFSKSLREGGKAKVDVEQAVAADVAVGLRQRIAGIPDVDGNYLGTDNPNASVTVEVGLPGHDVIWRGKQITFVEFGTGARGARGAGYVLPEVMAKAGYHPDPLKEGWWYPDAKLGDGKPIFSRGIPPYAPMANTAAMMRIQNLEPAKVVLRGALREITG